MFIKCVICSQGIGIALLVSQALIGIYSIVGVSWMFIYFRDSFITKQDSYQWAEPYDPYREGKENVLVVLLQVHFSKWDSLVIQTIWHVIVMLNAAHLLHWSVITVWQGLAFEVIHKSFPLPHNCGIINHPNVVSVAQTSDATRTLLVWRLLARKFDILNVSRTSSGTTSTLDTQMCSSSYGPKPSLNSQQWL